MLALSEIKINSGSCNLPPCALCSAAPQSLSSCACGGPVRFLFISSHLIRRVAFTQMEGASSQVARLPLFAPGQAVSHGAGLDEYADSVTMFHQSVFVHMPLQIDPPCNIILDTLLTRIETHDRARILSSIELTSHLSLEWSYSGKSMFES